MSDLREKLLAALRKTKDKPSHPIVQTPGNRIPSAGSCQTFTQVRIGPIRYCDLPKNDRTSACRDEQHRHARMARQRSSVQQVQFPAPVGRYLSVKEAAVYMGRPIGGIRWLIRQRKIAVIRCDGRVHLDRFDVDAYMEKHKWSQATD